MHGTAKFENIASSDVKNHSFYMPSGAVKQGKKFSNHTAAQSYQSWHAFVCFCLRRARAITAEQSDHHHNPNPSYSSQLLTAAGRCNNLGKCNSCFSHRILAEIEAQVFLLVFFVNGFISL